MKTDSVYRIKIGLVTLLAIALFVLMVYGISKFSLKPQKEIRIEFSFINSLEERAPVRFAGARVGEVKKIHLLTPNERAEFTQNPPYVYVYASIDQDIKIPKETKALVTTLGFMGEKYLELLPASRTSDYLSEGEPLHGEDPVPMDTVFASAKKSLDDMQIAAGKIITITTEMENRLPVLIGELEKTLASAQDLAGDAKGLTGDAKTMIHNNRENLEHLIDNARQMTIYMKSLSHVLASRPWKIVWGIGGPIPIESEGEKFVPPETPNNEDQSEEKTGK
jgi:phospholipid/cholesterol/gamma-HCH transport system substrate-binding protein